MITFCLFVAEEGVGEIAGGRQNGFVSSIFKIILRSLRREKCKNSPCWEAGSMRIDLLLFSVILIDLSISGSNNGDRRQFTIDSIQILQMVTKSSFPGRRHEANDLGMPPSRPRESGQEQRFRATKLATARAQGSCPTELARESWNA